MNWHWAGWLHSERLSRWVAGGLLLLAAWQAGRWVAALLEPVQPPHLPPLTFTHSGERNILSLPPALFGQSDAAPVQIEARRKVTAEQLGIKLLGVISFSNGEGVAIVRLKNGQRRAVRTGETIHKGLVLMQVAADKVVLSADGELVWVPIGRQIDQAVENQASSSSPAASGVHALAQQLRRQPFKLFDYLVAQPVPQGVRIQARPGQEALLQQLGLRNGDIINAIDGQPLKTLMQRPKQWQKLINQNRWRLRILRDGRYEEIEVNL